MGQVRPWLPESDILAKKEGMMNYFTLNNGIKIPAIGSGTNTFGRDNDDLKSSPTGNFTPFYQALNSGYELFDCAKSYGNEAGIGEALQKSGASRNKVFLVSKIPNRPEIFESEKTVRACIDGTLRDLRTDYVDLYLIHQPVSYADQALGKSMDAEKIVFVYKVLEKLLREGKTRAIGVANFTSDQLSVLMERTEVVPAVNQFRCNPVERNWETVSFCKEHHILPMAHSPMNFHSNTTTVPPDFAESYRKNAGEIGKAYGKQWGQVLLRYNYQNSICSIPKAHNPENQKKNIDIFDFALTKQEMSKLY